MHCFSAGRSLPALGNRALPARLGVWLEVKLRGRDPERMFPALYDRCTYSQLSEMLWPWPELRVIPQFLGAPYFSCLRPLQALYLGYEEWTVRRELSDWATYYLVVGRR